MGVGGSKLTPAATENALSEETGKVPSTPILANKILREIIEKDHLDPRSPSKHIARTPIELLSTVTDTPSLLSIPKIDTGGQLAVETPSKRHLILGIDPRSPSLEVQRTPIVVSADKQLPGEIRNKHLDKVKSSALLCSPKTVPPRLLDSNPVTPKIKPDTYKRKSFILLETNIDFTETDLDTVIKEKYLGKSLQNLSVSDDLSSEITDPRSPSVDFLRTPIQVCAPTQQFADKLDSHCVEVVEEHLVQSIDSNNVIKKSDACESNLPEAKADKVVDVVANEELIEEPLINSISNNEESPKSSEHSVDLSNLNDNEDETTEEASCDSSKELGSAKSAPVSPPSTIITITPKKSKSQPVTPPIIDVIADVKELDKKLTNLIYEDTDLVVCPRPVRVKEQARTPLGLRNGTDNRPPTAQKLKVSDKPRTSKYAISKIPVFKDKKIKVQCENTPPRSMRGGRSKKTQWDPKDDTMVI